MWFEKEYRVKLDQVYNVYVCGYVQVDDVTGYVIPNVTEVYIVDENDELIHEDHPDYPELMVYVHERDYEPEHWSE